MIRVEIDAAAERDVEIFERDREAVRALKIFEPRGVGGGRYIEADAGEIGREVQEQAPISLEDTLAVMFMEPALVITMCAVAV